MNTVTSNQSSPDLKNESLNGNVQFGKAIKENIVVGMIVSYGYANTYLNSPYQAKNSQYSAGVFYRKYKPLVKNLYFFGEVDAAYFHSRAEQGFLMPNNSGALTTSNGVSVSFIPGISYGIGKRMQIELLMPNIVSGNYSHSKIDYSPSPSASSLNHDESSFSFNANFNNNLLSNFGVGFKFILGK